MLYSMTMIPPVLVSLYYEDGSTSVFFSAFVINMITGLLCWLPVHNNRQELRNRDGFVIVVMFWTVLGISGATPFLLSDALNMSFTDAVFESLSGLTTTGATVLTHLDTLPKSILFYRQQIQWLGGMGIIVLAVAILPMLGIGGMQLYRAETPGPIKDSKLTPRITETAKVLWYIYVSLTLVCALSYWAAGMELFDAIGHAFSTIAIGGFSTHDSSIGYFNNPTIDYLCCFFMFIASVNFGLHFFCWRAKSLQSYYRDPEVQFFCFILALVFCITVYGLIELTQRLHPVPMSAHQAETTLRNALFQTISIVSTTGFATVNYGQWPILIGIALLFGSFIGGCAGSTCGGVKTIRILLMFKQGFREMKRLIYPSGIFTIKLGNKPVPDRVIEAVWGFVGAYICVFSLLLLAILATGLDFLTGFSAVTASLNNLGPGLGSVSEHYGNLGNTAKWILCFAMLLGRLEVFTLLILFNPMFWQK